MNQKDKQAWRDKNERLNRDVVLTIGTEVKDVDGNRGVVVKIIRPESDDDPISDHGTVWVWQSERTGYGADNCEHFTFTGWKRDLRIISIPGK